MVVKTEVVFGDILGEYSIVLSLVIVLLYRLVWSMSVVVCEEGRVVLWVVLLCYKYLLSVLFDINIVYMLYLVSVVIASTDEE